MNDFTERTIVRSLAIADLTINISTYLISILCLFIFARYKIFHPNLLRQLKLFFIYYFIAQLMRLIIAIYELTADNEHKLDFQNSYSSFFLHHNDGYITVLGATRVCVLTATYLSTSSAIAERSYATIALKTYETTISNKFFIISLAYQIIFGLIVGAIIYTEFLNLIAIGVSLLLSNLLFFTILYFLKRHNEYTYHTSLSNPSQYSLSERFQLQENFKAISIIGRVEFVLFILQLFAAGVMIGAYWFPFDLAQKCAYLLIQIIFSLYGYSAFLAGITGNQLWKNKFIQFFKTLLKGKARVKDESVQRADLGKQLLNRQGKKMVFTLNEEAELYFKQLQEGWN